MGDKTGIAWTSATWNPLRGCSRVSEGCRNCYAEHQASRFSGEGMPYHGLARDGRWTGVVRLVPEKLDQPLRWKRPRRIFVNSMSDLFHERVADEDIDRIFAVMALAQRHTFQVLTKRPERMRRYLTSRAKSVRFWRDAAPTGWALEWTHAGRTFPLTQFPLLNVHLGVSVEDQPTADARILDLLATPAAVRFVSYEPALAQVNLRIRDPRCITCGGWLFAHLPPHATCVTPGCPARGERTANANFGPRLKWIIVGGESGPRARPCDVAWIRSTVEQCRSAGVPCFVKQLGAHVLDRNDRGWEGDEPDHWPAGTAFEDGGFNDPTSRYQGAPRRSVLRDRAGADPAEWPADLRVQEFPTDLANNRPASG